MSGVTNDPKLRDVIYRRPLNCLFDLELFKQKMKFKTLFPNSNNVVTSIARNGTFSYVRLINALSTFNAYSDIILSDQKICF